MYKTKEEILMFEKAVEIQKNRVYEIGDRIYMPSLCKYSLGKLQSVSIRKEVGYVLDAEQVNNVNNEDLLHSHCVWLPYQHQLQELYRKSVKCSEGKSATFRFVMDIAGWLSNRLYPSKFTSMEQLWLGFIMQEKYNKKWNGKQWMIRKKH